MPTCNAEILSRVSWPSNESIHAGSSSSGSGLPSPDSPGCFSPGTTSPDSSLKRRRIRRTSSLGSVIREPFVIRSDARDLRSQTPVPQDSPREEEIYTSLASIIGWYPMFLLKMVNVIILAILPKTWKQLILALPMLWVSMWWWCVTQLIQLPLNIFRLFLSIIFTSKMPRKQKKRTVLISGGSTIQALHLARNLYSAGARVVVCEIQGAFALTRYSTAVSKFYTVPKPTSDQLQNYVRALCEIVDKEEAVYYIPVSATTPAYYDAVAKPHLELLGCSCFCPGIKEVWVLDDTLEVLKRCEKYGIITPNYYVVTSKEDVYRLYDTGTIRLGNYVMSTAGPSGLRDMAKVTLPLSRAELVLPNDITPQRPWVVVQDLEGDHYLTCTTVKESQVIANVTCKLDNKIHGLMPVDHHEIDQWLINFFSKLQLLRPVTGHVSFRFVVSKDTNTIKPLSSRVGISLPYICYTNVHPRLVWRPCKHFKRQNSGPLVNSNGTYIMPDAVLNTLKNPSLETVTELIGTVLDKREALFTYWDPLPYCAYYHMQLPLKNMLGFMRSKQDQFPRPLTTPVR
ncbi:uncharacterized protein LOC126734720 [Anthonomus grandis grandis]|uniref:uncharacterized protein LOC126734720 n=1 Tax=Anthonomus grandis grandis TaxID=2921223 RepID=UPI0021665048|nr:uncharacterized protein LOC126734720 [Anthonomus grandis grandis]